jgi:hypothetical protein
VRRRSLHVRRSGGWVGAVPLSDLGASHSGAHLGSHEAALGGGGSVGGHVGVLLLKLNSFDVLLVFDFLLHVLVSLEKFVVFGLSKLQSLVEVGLKLFLESIHLVLLFLDELGLVSDDLLLSLLHVLFSLQDFELLSLLLDLMGLSISIQT